MLQPNRHRRHCKRLLPDKPRTEAEIEAARTRIVRQHVSSLLRVTGFFEVERTDAEIEAARQEILRRGAAVGQLDYANPEVMLDPYESPARLWATRRYGAFAALTLRAIAKIKAGELEADKAAAHFEQVARNHRLRDAGAYDPRFIDMLITRVRHTKRASVVTIPLPQNVGGCGEA
jgi:hypothetical protein